MPKIVRALFCFMGLMGLSGCWGHVYPESNSFVRPANAPVSTSETVHVFVDGNGTFYPSGWESEMKRPSSWSADSLLNESNDNGTFRRKIEDGEREQLAELEAFAANKQRIFVLVHGYNNTMGDAEASYRLVEEKLDLRPTDGVVRFFWDGLQGTGIGAGKIWFNATGYSQLAGSRGLRRVLAQFTDKEVGLISHSRGASVILSALSNPVYDPDFLIKTEKVVGTWAQQYANFLSPERLPRMRKVNILMLAPAVDRIDFCDASEQRRSGGRFNCPTLRDLGHVDSLRYTVNSKDPTLNKYVGASGGFNPTGLGLRAGVGADLGDNYRFMQPYVFQEPASFHPFRSYIAHPVFRQMLKDAGYLKR